MNVHHLPVLLEVFVLMVFIHTHVSVHLQEKERIVKQVSKFDRLLFSFKFKVLVTFFCCCYKLKITVLLESLHFYFSLTEERVWQTIVFTSIMY